MQATTLNFKGASCVLFGLTMNIYHDRFNSGNVGHTHKMQFPVVKGQFATVKVPRVTASLPHLLCYSVVQERKDLKPLYQACRVKTSKTVEIWTLVVLIGFGLQAQMSVLKDTVTCQGSEVSFGAVYVTIPIVTFPVLARESTLFVWKIDQVCLGQKKCKRS